MKEFITIFQTENGYVVKTNLEESATRFFSFELDNEEKQLEMLYSLKDFLGFDFNNKHTNEAKNIEMFLQAGRKAEFLTRFKFWLDYELGDFEDELKTYLLKTAIDKG